MRTLTGTVGARFGIAGPNLDTIRPLLLARTGLPSMAWGTLNVRLASDYIVHADSSIAPDEYKDHVRLKLQRCRVRGHRMFIMRPESHEAPGGIGADVLELISPIPLRKTWGLVDGDSLTVEVEGDEEWWLAPEPGPSGAV